MAALVQTIPQQVSTVLLQTRPSSSSGTSSFATSSQGSQQQASRSPTMSLGAFNTGGGSGSYRSHQTMPVAPYAFTSTPGLVNTGSGQQRQSPTPHSRTENLTLSSIPQGQQRTSNAVSPQRLHHPAAGSVLPSPNSSQRSYVSQDDSILSSKSRPSDITLRPLSTINLPTPTPFLNISSPTGSAKPSPNRYRRSNQRGELNTASNQLSLIPSGSNGSGPTPTKSSPTPEESPPTSNSPSSSQISRAGNCAPGHVRVPSADDTHSEKPQHPELAKRYRRRSWASMDAAGSLTAYDQMPLNASIFTPLPETNSTKDPSPSPHPTDSRNGSADSLHSVASSTASCDPLPATVKSGSPTKGEFKPLSVPKLLEPSQGSSGSTAQSKPVPVNLDSAASGAPIPVSDKQRAALPGSAIESPSVQRLTSLAKMELKKPGKSRLRRAFSFGSTSELRKASAQNNVGKRELVDPDKSRQQQLNEELGLEQAAIAAQQEANGLGESIYSNHTRFFSGSTDNLSISSTASSASVMLRKMGRGMRKSTRSLVGLFRPKSLVGNPSDSITLELSAPQVSVVNVEAERKTITVSPDLPNQISKGTEFPKSEPPLKENKPKTVSAVEQSTTDTSSTSRKSIVGGEKERAEVLAAVRKGILKNTRHSSLLVKAIESKGTDLSTPRPPYSIDSPHSSAPSTPDDQHKQTGHKKRDSIKIDGDDYFLPDGKFTGSDAKSAPITPPQAAKNIDFNPRIEFFETWPSGEYDRRGDIATCNRLTPLLAQQIKEEINTFKMEMEVHETSKVYTHFL